MFFGGSPFEQFAGMHGGEGPGGGGGGGRRAPPADVDTTELYQILGIEKEASENDIKKAYRKLALKVCAIVCVCVCVLGLGMGLCKTTEGFASLHFRL